MIGVAPQNLSGIEPTYYLVITPQAIRSPALPAGSVLRSSSLACTTSEVPPEWKSELSPVSARVTPFGRHLDLRRSLSRVNIRQVARVMTLGVQVAVLFLLGIEVRTGGFEVGRRAGADLVDVEGVRAVGKAGELAR